MKNTSIRLLGFILGVPLLVTNALAADAPCASTPTPISQTSQVPIYKPPLRGTPKTSSGGTSRSMASSELILQVLASEHTGLTSSAQPTLYWYISKAVTKPLEFTLSDENNPHWFVERSLPAPNKPGIYRVQLSDYDLKPGVEYKWSVSSVTDPTKRSEDISTSGTIKRITSEATTSAKLMNASKQQQPFIYAEAGLWYDAIAALSELIDAKPEDKTLREQRAALLTQVGLQKVAEFDCQ